MRKLTVLGAGRSGLGTAILAQKQGWKVFVSDASNVDENTQQKFEALNIEFEMDGHTAAKVLNADEIMKSPGIPDSAPLVKESRKLGIPVISEIEFAGRYTNAKIVGITGSNGKTTTTSLTYDLLKRSGLNVGIAGNIGNSFAYEVATENYDVYVLELSSFQLDGVVDFKSDVAVLLNITPDHLDRYDYKLKNYAAAKFNIIKNQTADDVFIYCKDDPITNNYLAEYNISSQIYAFSQKEVLEEGAYLNGDQMNINVKKKPLPCQLKS